MTYALYIGGFILAAGLMVAASRLVWARILNAMPNPPHWMDAFELVWCDVYGMDWAERPRVIFVWGESFEHAGKQVAGLSEETNAVTVAVPDTVPGQQAAKISDTQFAHELRHQARLRIGFGPDLEHKAADWGPGGIVEYAVKKVRERGW